MLEALVYDEAILVVEFTGVKALLYVADELEYLAGQGGGPLCVLDIRSSQHRLFIVRLSLGFAPICHLRAQRQTD